MQLKRTRPRDAVEGEEFETTGHGPRRWVIDPIDGTHNFVRGVPAWATLISLVDNEMPVLGLVAAPALGRRWWATNGSGAWSGRSLSSAKRIHVSKVSRIEDASLSYSSLKGWRGVDRYDEFLSLTEDCWRTRAYGDFWSYMLVAEERSTSRPSRSWRSTTWPRWCRSSPRPAGGSRRWPGSRARGVATRSPRTACSTTRCWPASAPAAPRRDLRRFEVKTPVLPGVFTSNHSSRARRQHSRRQRRRNRACAWHTWSMNASEPAADPATSCGAPGHPG